MNQMPSPIFSKTQDLLLWLMAHTDKFPKSERFRLAMRMEDALFDFHGCLLEAACLPEAKTHLRRGDMYLKRLLFYFRLSHERQLFNLDQYHFASAAVLELGRLLGGWSKDQEDGKIKRV